MDHEPDPEVRAAGGVIWRRDAAGRVEVLVVHRPKYDDWSLPKGKLEPGEDHRAAAVREVEEETGLHCELGAELSSTRYVDRKGRDKVVRYWAMRVVAGEFRPNVEVDEARWMAVDEAGSFLSYDRDAAVVADLGGCLVGDE